MKIKAFIHAKYNEHTKDYDFMTWSGDMSGCNMGYVLIEECEVEFVAPPRDVLVNGTVSEYRDMQKKIRAEAEEKCNRIQRSIDDLLCLEYKPSQEAPV